MTDPAPGTVSRHSKGEAIWNPQAGPDLDLLTRARDRLARLAEASERIDPTPWKAEQTIETLGRVKCDLDEDIAEVGGDIATLYWPTAELIVALRGCVPYLIERFDRAIHVQGQAASPELYSRDEIELARVILGETGVQS